MNDSEVMQMIPYRSHDSDNSHELSFKPNVVAATIHYANSVLQYSIKSVHVLNKLLNFN